MVVVSTFNVVCGRRAGVDLQRPAVAVLFVLLSLGRAKVLVDTLVAGGRCTLFVGCFHFKGGRGIRPPFSRYTVGTLPKKGESRPRWVGCLGSLHFPVKLTFVPARRSNKNNLPSKLLHHPLSSHLPTSCVCLVALLLRLRLSFPPPTDSFKRSDFGLFFLAAQ